MDLKTPVQPSPFLYLLRRTVVLALLILGVTTYILFPPEGCFSDYGHVKPPAPATAPDQAQAPAPPPADEGFLRADRPRDWAFPQDHGKHPPYQTEWWYYTGILGTTEGRRFGVQVTIFRRALVADMSPRPSAWAARDVYLGHFAVGDLEAKRFHVAERVARGAADLAGASEKDHQVWLENWRIEPMEGGFRFDITAPAEGVAFQADCRYTHPPTLHGKDPGLSLKGAVGQASYYYSLPRIPTAGTLTLGKESYRVRGEMWMDHEFGSNQLALDQTGWDWFALQLEDGRSVMLYQLRRKDGTPDPGSSGTLIASDGTPTHLPNGSFTLTPGRRWTSPASGATYPVAWRVEVPGYGLDLRVAPAMEAQELDTAGSTGITYWEGAIAVTGTHPGQGYLEMTGYAQSLESRF